VGIGGRLFWWLVGGVGAGITVFFVFLVGCSRPVVADFVWRRGRAGAARLAYIFGLRQGKPPGYDRDMVERVFTGNGFAPEPNRRAQTSPPLANCHEPPHL
jgi:hypothetical protein